MTEVGGSMKIYTCYTSDKEPMEAIGNPANPNEAIRLNDPNPTTDAVYLNTKNAARRNLQAQFSGQA